MDFSFVGGDAADNCWSSRYWR